MQVIKLSEENIAIYLKALKELIKSTINLPPNAITFFCNQWTEERILNNINIWLYLMARDGSKTEGILLGAPVEGGVGTIIWILVNKKSQNKGIGSLLFEEACLQYKKMGAHKVKLTVPDSETIKFYLKQGMVLEGTHKKIGRAHV